MDSDVVFKPVPYESLVVGRKYAIKFLCSMVTAGKIYSSDRQNKLIAVFQNYNNESKTQAHFDVHKLKCKSVYFGSSVPNCFSVINVSLNPEVQDPLRLTRVLFYEIIHLSNHKNVVKIIQEKIPGFYYPMFEHEFIEQTPITCMVTLSMNTGLWCL